MKCFTLTFIRHAESLANIDSNVYFTTADADIPLSDKGKSDATFLGDELSRLKGAMIYHSSYLRAKQTAQIIAAKINGLNSFIKESPLLVERKWGRELNHLYYHGKSEDKHFNFYYKPDGGESFFECYQRATLFLNSLKHDLSLIAENTPIIIVTHGEYMKMIDMIMNPLSNIDEFHKNGPLSNLPRNCQINNYSIVIS